MSIIKEILLDGIEAFLLLGVFSLLYNRTNFIIKNKIRVIIFLFYLCYQIFGAQKISQLYIIH